MDQVRWGTGSQRLLPPLSIHSFSEFPCYARPHLPVPPVIHLSHTGQIQAESGFWFSLKQIQAEPGPRLSGANTEEHGSRVPWHKYRQSLDPGSPWYKYRKSLDPGSPWLTLAPKAPFQFPSLLQEVLLSIDFQENQALDHGTYHLHETLTPNLVPLTSPPAH